jgi:hypothetical protein
LSEKDQSVAFGETRRRQYQGRQVKDLASYTNGITRLQEEKEAALEQELGQEKEHNQGERNLSRPLGLKQENAVNQKLFLT